MPLLTIVTRPFRRPKALKRNMDSVQMQTDSDYEQIFLVDDVGIGIAAAGKRLFTERDKVHGDYVYILDDDAYLLERDFVKILRETVARENNPEVIIFKSEFAGWTLPSDEVWEKKVPKFGGIDTHNLCVRQDIWKKYIEVYGVGVGCDYHFALAMHEAGLRFVWVDVKIARMDEFGQGKTEY